MTTLLEMTDIRVRLKGRTVLDIPSLAIAAGSITGLVGANGSGKTTLLRLLALVDHPTSGTIRFRGRPTRPFADETRHRVALVLQEPYLLKRSVGANISYGLKLRGTTTDLDRHVKAALDMVGLPFSFQKRQWYELSGGEAQRVALAARLALRPDCLLLDEPTANVDQQSAELIRQAILTARRQWHTTLVISSHQHRWLRTVCDTMVDLWQGRILPFTPENTVHGPWLQEQGNTVRRVFADGQSLLLPAPPAAAAVAALQAGAVSLLPQPAADPDNRTLLGKINAIFADQRDREMVRLRIQCAEQFFTLTLTAQTWRQHDLQPGQTVGVVIDEKGIYWLAE